MITIEDINNLYWENPQTNNWTANIKKFMLDIVHYPDALIHNRFWWAYILDNTVETNKPNLIKCIRAENKQTLKETICEFLNNRNNSATWP